MTELVRQGAPPRDVDLTVGERVALLREQDVLGDTWADFSAFISDDDTPEGVYAKLERLGRFLGQSLDANRWWIGEYLVFGEALLGEDFYQLADAVGLRPATLMEYRRVAAQVPRSRRRPDLHFSHHKAVASLDPERQAYWLERSENDQLSVSDLSDRLRIERAGPDDPPPDPAELQASVVPHRVIEVARNIVATARREGGHYLIPSEQFVQLRAALGSGE